MINLQDQTPKILVIGDLMIDHCLWGACERISPEAPVQVVNVTKESSVLYKYDQVFTIYKIKAHLFHHVAIIFYQKCMSLYSLIVDCYLRSNSQRSLHFHFYNH